jgi:hypothetical protein
MHVGLQPSSEGCLPSSYYGQGCDFLNDFWQSSTENYCDFYNCKIKFKIVSVLLDNDMLFK